MGSCQAHALECNLLIGRGVGRSKVVTVVSGSLDMLRLYHVRSKTKAPRRGTDGRKRAALGAGQRPRCYCYSCYHLLQLERADAVASGVLR